MSQDVPAAVCNFPISCSSTRALWAALGSASFNPSWDGRGHVHSASMMTYTEFIVLICVFMFNFIQIYIYIHTYIYIYIYIHIYIYTHIHTCIDVT